MDSNIITILISAFGGAVVSALTGFLTVYINNKHSFKMLKEKDKYEYEQYTNKMLYKYLVKLETDCLIHINKNPQVTIHRAHELSQKIQTLYSLVRPFLDDSLIINLDRFSLDEIATHGDFLEKYLHTDDSSVNDDDRVRLDAWGVKLPLFRKALLDGIQNELRKNRN